jgi:hypothetical protein
VFLVLGLFLRAGGPLVLARARLEAGRIHADRSLGGIELIAAHRRLTLGVLGTLCMVVALVVFASGSASAALTHPFVSSFGSFTGVEGIAVDHSTGDTYVYDAGAGMILKFDSAGSPINFSATGTNAIENVGSAGEGEGEIAVDSSPGPAKGDIYLANDAHVGIYSTTGKSLGELTAEVGRPWGTPCGVAVDAAGNVYVGLHGSRVNKYSPAANPVLGSDYVSSLWGLANACDIAVDGEGSVYVDGWSEGPVFKYEALQFNALETPASGTEVASTGRALAIDPASNDLYVARYGEVAQYEPTGGLIDTFSGSEANAFGNTHGIAIGTSGNVLVSDNNQARIDIFGPVADLADATIGEATNVSKAAATLHGTVNPNGVAITTCQFEYNGQTVACSPAPGSGSGPVSVEASITSLSPHTVYSYRLTVDDASGVSHSATAQFKTQSLPIVQSVSATEVSRTTARVNAAIDPAGTNTTYRFEYGPDTSYGSHVPVPDGNLGSADEEIQVSQFLTGLQPGDTYHYRVVATSAIGTSTSEDQTFTTFAPRAPEPADTCPNAAYRVGPSTGLPDCRAYEMVSPVEKNGGNVAGDAFGQTFAPEWGDQPGEVDRAVFMSKTLFGEVKGSGGIGYTQYIAERGPDGWSTKGITPTLSTSVGGQVFFGKTELKEFSSDLSVGALIAYTLPDGPPAARPKSENEYLEDTTTARPFAAITDASHEGEAPGWPPNLPFAAFLETPVLGGASSSLDVVTFMSRVNYLPETHGNEFKAYVYEHGVLKLLGVLPSGEIPPGGSTLVAEVETGSAWWNQSAIARKDTVSDDGSRILFEVPEFPHQLFMRKSGSASVLISESETAVPVTAEDVQLEAATPDLKHILFHTSTRLLDSAPEGGGLYMYTDSPNPQSESNLTYIGESNSNRYNTGEPKEDGVLGMSEDGSRIYYLPLSTSGTTVDLWESGQTRQIAPAPGVPLGRAIMAQGGQVEARVTPDGNQMAFMSPDQLTSDAPVSTSAVTAFGSSNSEMYVYKEDTNTLTCVSCPPTHTIATAGIETEVKATSASVYQTEPYRPRFMSRDGRYVFFNTTEALVPQDTNGMTDAYEYDTVTGRLSLLSTGMGEDGAWFVDANADGHDVFLVTRQQLSRWDPDKLFDLYDARVEGGLPEPPALAVPCDGDACQGTPSAAPSFNTASGFTGLGNPSFAKLAKAKAKAKVKAKPNLRLRRALAVCRKQPRRKRTGCERSAQRRFGAEQSPTRSNRTLGKGE